MPRRDGREGERRRRARFGRVVREALRELRDGITGRQERGELSAGIATLMLEALDEVDITVLDEPDARQRRENRDADELLGLYEGVPRTEWAADQALLPPRITLFRLAIEDLSASPQVQRREIRATVLHELAHHLGYSDEQLHRLGLGDAD